MNRPPSTVDQNAKGINCPPKAPKAQKIMQKSQQFILLFLILGCLAAVIDLEDLPNYADQPIPNYIDKDNTPPNNELSDARAVLGRVLFYDKQLSANNTVSCATCHIQAYAFSDTAVASVGVNGTTGRHAMRLVNARFSTEVRAFWDERAANLEEQVTQPIQDHAEMGYSGEDGDPGLEELMEKMAQLDYYQRLFEFVYGDAEITEERMQLALAQFVRSIQSFDAKFDAGRAQVPNDGTPFPNFTHQENQGKRLFMTPPQVNAQGIRVDGGAGCAGCHAPPEFDIRATSRNNGVIASLDGGIDLTNTRSPSLRDLVNPDGELNGPMMHNGAFHSLLEVIDHYDSIPRANPQLDNRLRPGGNLLRLRLSDEEKAQLEAFLLTLTGSQMYTDERWSDPFDGDGLVILPDVTTSTMDLLVEKRVKIYPNPVQDQLRVERPEALADAAISVYNVQGQLLLHDSTPRTSLDVSGLQSGCYFLLVGEQRLTFIKR
ncbi:MAG: cytochrome c peroxidase [Bacteroidota bacterium]